ncbi:hypothetical protein TcasGA2_TC030910 [Tribolium castaneum]|nr:hypothetical protein TcasGA2_TC030910 [Tribolium castaneum]
MRNNSSNVEALLYPDRRHSSKRNCYCNERNISPQLFTRPRECLYEDDLNETTYKIPEFIRKKSAKKPIFERPGEVPKPQHVITKYKSSYFDNASSGTSPTTHETGKTYRKSEKFDFQTFSHNYKPSLGDTEEASPQTSETFPPVVPTDLKNLADFRKDHYFETHSTEDLIKEIPPHECVHKFSLDERKLPFPLNPDAYGSSRCIICDKPMEKPLLNKIDEREKPKKAVFPKFYKYGLAPKRIYLGGSDRIDVVLDEGEECVGKWETPNYYNTYALRYQKGVKSRTSMYLLISIIDSDPLFVQTAFFKVIIFLSKHCLMSVGWKRTDSGGYECFLEYEKTSNMGCVEYAATFGSVVLLILTLPFSLFWCFKVVQEYERAVIFRLGRLRTGGARGPGIFFILPCVDSYCKVDLRTVSFDVPPQEALTKDSVTVTVDAVVYYRIQDPLNAVTKVTNYSNSTRLLAMTTLRNILGTRNLAEILSDREAISHAMQTNLDVATDPWGVKVERVEIKDVSLPQQLQRAMAAEAEASREARAKVIAAEGEMKASRALKEAADVINESPAALQLRKCIECTATASSFVLFVITFPISIFACLKIVQEYERAVIFRLGRLRSGGPRGPGIFFILPCIDDYIKIDLRTVTFDIPPQEVLSKDSVTIWVDAVVYFRVEDPLAAILKVENFRTSTHLLAMTTLRNILGTKTLMEILSDRENIVHLMQTQLDVATDPWGIKVERVEITDIRLPQSLQRAMATEAEASREARAKIIAAEGEMNAAKALKLAADTIIQSPAAIQLRYLQTLSNISAEKNSTIVFPIPIELFSHFKRGN